MILKYMYLNIVLHLCLNQFQTKKKERTAIEIANSYFVKYIGKVLKIDEDHVEIIKHLGSGAFGTVYEVFHYNFKENLALKIILYNKQYEFREKTILLNLKHENIIEYKKFYYIKIENLFFVCILLPKCEISLPLIISTDDLHKKYVFSVNNITNDENSVYIDYFKKFFKEALEALKYLNENKIMHRDIKPDNILIKNDKLIICDFGSAKKYIENDINNLNICTLSYRAPEILKNNRITIQKSIFGLWVLLS
ncbi:Glycogen synthase kinase-3 beta [Gurleya vavrai]